jgi:hypothetical protein
MLNLIAALVLALTSPSISGFTASAAAPDSTVTLGTQVYAQGMIPGDTVRYDYYSAGVIKKTRRFPTLTDKTTLPAPTYGATTEYKVCHQIERGGRAGTKYPAAPVCWTWTFTRTAPVPVIDSVKQIVLRPSSTPEIASGAARQICAFGVTQSGRRVKMANSWNNPVCEEEYQRWLAEKSA